MSMKIGVTMGFSHLTPVSYIAAAARFIDEAGFHSIWVPEHVLFFPDYASRYPYSPDGRVPGNPEGVLDPFTALTFIAAQTQRVRLGTGVCLVPQRQPVYTAKMVADVDYLSGGRVDFGVGIGWLAEEFDAPDGFSTRANANEYIQAMQAMATASRRFPVKPSSCRIATSIQSRCNGRIRRSFSAAKAMRRSRALRRSATVGTDTIWSRRACANGWRFSSRSSSRRDANGPTSTCSSARTAIALPPTL
jgi:hypothetical protein